MADTPWTPGPWEARGDAYHAAVFTSDGRLISSPTGNDTSRPANARLIAAAPELYEALEQMCGAYAALCEQFGQTHHNVAGSKYSHARAALAKARGQ